MADEIAEAAMFNSAAALAMLPWRRAVVKYSIAFKVSAFQNLVFSDVGHLIIPFFR
jgi:hypothetical protein